MNRRVVTGALAAVLTIGLTVGPGSPVTGRESAAILSSLQLPAGAVALDVDDVGGRVFVLFANPAKLSIRDSRSLEEIRSIDLGGTASTLTVDEVGQRAFVRGDMNGNIRIVDIPSGAVSEPLALPNAQIVGAAPVPAGLVLTGTDGIAYLFDISTRRLVNQMPVGQPLSAGAVGSDLYWNPFDGRVVRIPVQDLTGQRPVSSLREWPVALDMFTMVGEGPVFLGGRAGFQRLDLNTSQTRFRETDIALTALGANSRHMPGRIFWSQSRDFASSEFHISDSETLSDLFSFPVGSAISDIAVAPDGLFALSARDSKLFAIDSSATGATAPRKVRLQSTTRSIDARWLAPEVSGSGGVLRYRVSVSPSGKSCITKRLRCTIQGLNANTTYEVRVSAENNLGWGAESKVASVRTKPLPARPPSRPPTDTDKPARPVS